MSAPRDTVSLASRDGAAYITLDRPPLNVLDIPTNQLLASRLRSLRGHDDVKAVVLRGAGAQAFSAGVEIADHVPERIGAMLEAFHGVIRELVRLERPTVAAVRGLALGGGCELAIACDLVIAEESASFGFPEIKLGCFPPVAAVLLPAIVGPKRATELILTGEPITARQAQAMGLVTRLVPDGSLEEELDSYVGLVTRQSTAAVAMARRGLGSGGREAFLDELARVERLYLDELAATADAREGIAAWLEKRAPVWRNR